MFKVRKQEAKIFTFKTNHLSSDTLCAFHHWLIWKKKTLKQCLPIHHERWDKCLRSLKPGSVSWAYDTSKQSDMIHGFLITVSSVFWPDFTVAFTLNFLLLCMKSRRIRLDWLISRIYASVTFCLISCEKIWAKCLICIQQMEISFENLKSGCNLCVARAFPTWKSSHLNVPSEVWGLVL